MAEKYEMGDMPEAEGNPGEELAMEGSDFESPDEEKSPVEDLKAQLAGLDKDSLKELEAAIADELSKQEESDEEEAPETEGEAPEGEAPQEASGDLSSMFG